MAMGDYEFDFGGDYDLGSYDDISFDDSEWDDNWFDSDSWSFDYDLSTGESGGFADSWFDTDSYSDYAYGDGPNTYLDEWSPYGDTQLGMSDYDYYKGTSDSFGLLGSGSEDDEGGLLAGIKGMWNKNKDDKDFWGAILGLGKAGYGAWQANKSQERADELSRLNFEREKEMARLRASLKSGGSGKAAAVAPKKTEERREGDFTKRM